MIKNFCEGDFENEVENALQNIVTKSSSSLNSMIKLFNLLDDTTNISSELQSAYTIANRTIEIINTSKQLEQAMREIQINPFISFDSEQKPTFKKGEASHGVSLIQLASKSKCYLIQMKQIRNIKPLVKLLENEKIIKIGTGLKGDKSSLFKEFNLRLKSTIDLEDVFKKLSAKNQIGAKKAAFIILNEKLLKSKNMSRSNWENEDLSIGQVKYASEDACVVYDVLNKMLEIYPFVMNIMPAFFQAKYSKKN